MSLDLGRRIDLEKIARDTGFEVVTFEGDLARLASPDVPLRPQVRLIDSRWLVCLDDRHVLAAIEAEGRFGKEVGGSFRLESDTALEGLLFRAWRLSHALPQSPLKQFESEVAALETGGPTSPDFGTEGWRLTRERIGQDVFRRALDEWWEGRCAVTGVDESALLRASHIKPWARCDSDEERLDVYNGLLLTADWDAAFDKGLVSFADDGAAMYSSTLSARARARLGSGCIRADRPLAPAHLIFLSWHRFSLFVR